VFLILKQILRIFPRGLLLYKSVAKISYDCIFFIFGKFGVWRSIRITDLFLFLAGSFLFRKGRIVYLIAIHFDVQWVKIYTCIDPSWWSKFKILIINRSNLLSQEILIVFFLFGRIWFFFFIQSIICNGPIIKVSSSLLPINFIDLRINQWIILIDSKRSSAISHFSSARLRVTSRSPVSLLRLNIFSRFQDRSYKERISNTIKFLFVNLFIKLSIHGKSFGVHSILNQNRTCFVGYFWTE
jgi:hypothetical protein